MMTAEEYRAVAKTIWQKFVPKRGQAETVQGELLRANEKLRDEAQRNGNGNFSAGCHVLLIGYLREYLGDSKVFDATSTKVLNADLDRLLDGDAPYLEDDLYDRVECRIVDWYINNPNPIPHVQNPALYC